MSQRIGTAIWASVPHGFASLRPGPLWIVLLAPLSGALKIDGLTVPAGSTGVIPLPSAINPMRYRLADPSDVGRVAFISE